NHDPLPLSRTEATMPFAYDIDEGRRLVRVTGSGEVTSEAWFGVLGAAFADPRYRAGFGLVFDRTTFTHIPDTIFVRQWIGGQARAMREAGARRMAIIVAEPVVYGMMRMASAYAESAGFTLEPYWSEAEALAALGHTAP